MIQLSIFTVLQSSRRLTYIPAPAANQWPPLRRHSLLSGWPAPDNHRPQQQIVTSRVRVPGSGDGDTLQPESSQQQPGQTVLINGHTCGPRAATAELTHLPRLYFSPGLTVRPGPQHHPVDAHVRHTGRTARADTPAPVSPPRV